jgi:uncharacterized protein YaeQ
MGRPFRCQTRLSLSDLDRQVYFERNVVLAQSPDEPDEHALLRFLAHLVVPDEQLEDAAGWMDDHQPDAHAHDLVGALTRWVECGTPPIKRLVKALGRHKDAQFHALFVEEAEARAFLHELRAQRPRNLERLELILIPEPIMAALERVGSRSMTWTATVSDGELYLDCDGTTMSGRVRRLVAGHARVFNEVPAHA